MYRSLFVILISLIGIGVNQGHSQSLAQQRCQSLDKGLNISNWLEEYWNANWPDPNKYTKQHFIQMQEAGIVSVRLPINFHAVVDTIAPYTVDTEHLLFDLVDSVIEWTEELDMMLLIDNHHGWDLNNENWRYNLPRFSHVWGVVANRYQHLDPNRVIFELMNEPTLGFPQDSLRIMYEHAIDSIRFYTLEHSIVVSPHWGGTGMVFSEFQPLSDTNLIYTWHVYDPLDFSHQGLTWHDPFFPSGNPFPNSDTTFWENWLYTGWERVLDWKETHQLPLFLGEFGLSSHCDSLSSCNWLDYNMTRVVQNDISWFYWDWQWDFTMFNSHVISEDSIYPCYKYYLGLYGDDTFTDIDQVHFDNEIEARLFPNPSSAGNFMVEVEAESNGKNQIWIYSNSGHLLYSNSFKGRQFSFEENLKSGIYVVCIKNSNSSAVRKLVVP